MQLWPVIAFSYIFFVLVINAYSLAELSNDIEELSRGGNLPKPVSYFTLQSVDETPSTSPSSPSEKSQKARFTYPNAAGLDTYGTSALTHSFYPFKFDVGGLLLGAFVGLGALILIPKLMHILVPELALYGNTYGTPYGRNLDSSSTGFIQMVSQFEKTLLQNNINSSECLQKAICSYVQSTKRNGASRITENKITEDYSLSNLFNYLIAGSRLRSAIENGKQDIECGVLYPKCPFNRDSVTSRIKRLIFDDSTEDEN